MDHRDELKALGVPEEHLAEVEALKLPGGKLGKLWPVLLKILQGLQGQKPQPPAA